MTSRTVLLTGFDAFDGAEANPSQLVAQALDGETIDSHRIVGATLPTEFARSVPALYALLDEHRPALVIALGLAGGRAEISLERVAINLIDARIADNAGAQPVDARVVDGGANAYFATLPVKAMLAALRHAGIPAALSHSAGTFVCNQVFYALMHRLARSHGRARGGFIHVPWLPERAIGSSPPPSLPLATLVSALRLCVHTALNTPLDLHYAAGSTH